MDSHIIETLSQVLNNAHNIAVIPSVLAGDEVYAASAGLYLSLKNSGKNPTLIYTKPVPEKFKDLIIEHEIVSNVDYRELFVTVDYSETPASKVNYEVENDKLVFKLGPVHKNFDTNKVKAELRGYMFDTAIIVGAKNHNELDAVFNEFSLRNGSTQIVNLDNSLENSRFGNTNVVDNTKDTLSLLVLETIVKSDLKLNSHVAKALLEGITYR